MKLADLVGLHLLTCVNRVRIESRGEKPETETVIAYIELDGQTYTMKGFNIVNRGGHLESVDVIDRNWLGRDVRRTLDQDRFAPIQVLATMDDTIQTEQLHFHDCTNGRRILSVGCDRIASHHFSVDFRPELAARNLMVSADGGCLAYPGDWIIAS